MTVNKKSKFNQMMPSGTALGGSAQLSRRRTAPTVTASAGPNSSACFADFVKKAEKQVAPPARTGLWISIFFDGTGNNLDADLPTEEHSNVARLYRAHLQDGPKALHRIYVPGIGTNFKDVKDNGSSTLGSGFGAGGEARLGWAMSRLNLALAGGSGAVNVALFGFSRGAALARAFARRLGEKRCAPAKSGGWVLHGTQRPIRVYFMGIFDTVASVGLPTSTSVEAVTAAAGPLRLALSQRSSIDNSASLWAIATGRKPGADPCPGFIDGHADWADDLRIHPMVEKCVHMVACHEFRNSFPLDSALEGVRYPQGCVEMVYPGCHSDVGGGYRLAEGARSKTSGSMLSLIPLREMYKRAIEAGVPFVPELKTARPMIQKDFAHDRDSAAAFQTLQARFYHYLDVYKATAGVNVPLGQAFLASTKIYYQWRFHKLAVDLAARLAHKPTADEASLSASEKTWGGERAALEKQKDAAWKQYKDYLNKSMPDVDGQDYPLPRTPEQQRYKKLADQAGDAYYALVARVETLPGTEGALAKNLKIYDEQLLLDVQVLKSLVKRLGKEKLRPHYRALLEAYEAEFEQGKGLKDKELIAFFDEYVHDSLAGFAQDATLPSDPRIVYIGGDKELKYACNPSVANAMADMS